METRHYINTKESASLNTLGEIAGAAVRTFRLNSFSDYLQMPEFVKRDALVVEGRGRDRIKFESDLDKQERGYHLINYFKDNKQFALQVRVDTILREQYLILAAPILLTNYQQEGKGQKKAVILQSRSFGRPHFSRIISELERLSSELRS